MRNILNAKEVLTGNYQLGFAVGFIPCIMVEVEVSIINGYKHITEVYTKYRRATFKDLTVIIAEAQAYRQLDFIVDESLKDLEKSSDVLEEIINLGDGEL